MSLILYRSLDSFSKSSQHHHLECIYFVDLYKLKEVIRTSTNTLIISFHKISSNYIFYLTMFTISSLPLKASYNALEKYSIISLSVMMIVPINHLPEPHSNNVLSCGFINSIVDILEDFIFSFCILPSLVPCSQSQKLKNMI